MATPARGQIPPAFMSCVTKPMALSGSPKLLGQCRAIDGESDRFVTGDGTQHKKKPPAATGGPMSRKDSK